ncbi:MAG: 30S ribosome-binding factor RbfA [Burkholderiales bacterium]|nr:30S ribosome-binding factor RbfA [Burkholderiales bacterium]
MIKPKKPGRANRIEDQIQRDLAELIPKEIADPKLGLVTITGCKITPDYAHATVYFTSLGSTPEVATAILNKASPILYQRIFKLLQIHTVPQLHFKYDHSVASGFEMDQLIKKAREEDNEKIKPESDDKKDSD